MKKKIVGIFICMLVIATILPATGAHNEKTLASTGGIELVPVLDFERIAGGLFGISVLLVNSGEGTAENISWQMNASGGLFFYPKSISGIITVLGPDEEEKIKIMPAFGLGNTTLTFYCRYKMAEITSCDVDIEVKQEWQDRSFFIFHSFPASKQLNKSWVDTDFSYINNRTYTGGVEFNYAGINNMHNVRVVLGLPLFSRGVEFLGACKFTNGTGILYECWVTEEIVMHGDAHWEVELVGYE